MLVITYLLGKRRGQAQDDLRRDPAVLSGRPVQAAPPKQVVKYRPYPKYPFPKLRGWRARLSPTRVIEGAAWTRGGSWTNLIYVLFIARAVKKSMKRQPEVLPSTS